MSERHGMLPWLGWIGVTICHIRYVESTAINLEKDLWSPFMGCIDAEAKVAYQVNLTLVVDGEGGASRWLVLSETRWLFMDMIMLSNVE